MNFRNRIFGECAEFLSKKDDINLKINDFINRLILFETFVLKSIRLKEIRYLIEYLGINGIQDLLRTGALEIQCFAVQLASIGQAAPIRKNQNRDVLPLLSFCIDRVKASDWSWYIEKNIEDFDEIIGLSGTSKRKLKNIIYDNLLEPPQSFGLESVKSLSEVLINNNILVKESIKSYLKNNLWININIDEFEIKIFQIDKNDFKIDTNLGRLLKCDQNTLHKIIERSILSIGSIHLRIEEMHTFNALSGFRIGDLGLFEKRLDFLIDSICPEHYERGFKRVLEIKNFPLVEISSERIKIDVRRLLKIRESKEISEFKHWLSNIDSLSDDEIKKMLSNIKNKISDYFNRSTFRILKFLVTTFALGPTFGAVGGFIDNFLLNKIFSTNGPFIFINKLYPSIFKNDFSKTINKKIKK